MPMRTLETVRWDTLPDTAITLLVAFILGSMIGFERQYRQRTAGLKTNILVAIGAAVFVNMAKHLFGDEGAIRVGACVVSGIGFLGAGIIMREAGSVVGLNTAAILWCSAAVGTCVGGGLFVEATVATLFILGTNMLMSPIAVTINKRPIALSDLEGVCGVYVITHRKHSKEAMAFLRDELRKRKYYVRLLDVHSFGGDEIKIMAVINSSSADAAELDELVESTVASPIIDQAYWSRGVT